MLPYVRPVAVDDLVAVLIRVMKRQAAGRGIDDFMTVPHSRPG
jgi:hypothetical protein